MAIFSDAPSTHSIHLNGKLLIQGDQQSMQVVYANLSGKNFVDPPAWKGMQSYPEYLASMQLMWGIDFPAGGVLTLDAMGTHEAPMMTHTLDAEALSAARALLDDRKASQQPDTTSA